MSKEFLNKLEFAFFDIQGSSGHSLKRDRLYDGQPHTDSGTRGKTEVKGLTMRDISDCIVLAFLACGGIDSKNPVHDDMYKIEDMNKLDPGAVIKNAMCNIEKMMGIYPNVPPLTQTGEKTDE